MKTTNILTEEDYEVVVKHWEEDILKKAKSEDWLKEGYPIYGGSCVWCKKLGDARNEILKSGATADASRCETGCPLQKLGSPCDKSASPWSIVRGFMGDFTRGQGDDTRLAFIDGHISVLIKSKVVGDTSEMHQSRFIGAVERMIHAIKDSWLKVKLVEEKKRKKRKKRRNRRKGRGGR